MKILLIQPLSRSLNFFDNKGVTVAPLGLMLIAQVLIDRAHQVKILDRNLLDQNFEEVLKNYKPDLVGVSLCTGPLIIDAINIAKISKNLLSDNVKVVFGGVHPTVLPEQTLTNEFIDYLVIGEGEETIIDLVEALANNSNFSLVKGIGFKKDGQIIITEPRPFLENLDNLPFLPWHLINYKRYLKYEAGLVTSRGCPHRCKFCYNEKFNKRRWRAMSAKRVLAEIEHLIKIYPKVNRLKFFDDNFTTNRQRFYEILDGLPKRLDLFLETRVNYVNEEMMKRLSEFHDVQLFLGIESGTQEMLDKMQKDITLEQSRKAFELIHKYKIAASGSFIIGVPGETIDQVKKTWKFVRKLNPTKYTACPYIPYPGSKFFDEFIASNKFILPKTLEEWSTFGNYEKYTNLSGVPLKLIKAIQFKSIILTLFNYLLNFRIKDLKDKLGNIIDDGLALGKKLAYAIGVIKKH